MTNEQTQIIDNLVSYFQDSCKSHLVVPNQSHSGNDIVLQWDCHNQVKLMFTIKPDGTTLAETVSRYGYVFSHSFSSMEALELNNSTFLPAGIVTCIRDLK